MQFRNFVQTVGILCLVKLSATLDLHSSMERSCIQIHNVAQIDQSYWNTIRTLYYPLMSRHDIYLTAMDLLERDASQINEGKLYYDGQIYFEDHHNGSLFVKGFNGFQREFRLTDLAPGVSDFRPVPGLINAYAGTTYAVLTDNRTYILYTFCSDQNQMTWFVFSSTPTLTAENTEQVLRHVKELGFSEEYFTEQRYNFAHGSSPLYY